MRIFALVMIIVSSTLTVDLGHGNETEPEVPWETKAFDVAFGDVQILYSGELQEEQIINCRFSIDDYRNSEDRFASVALMLTSSEPTKYDIRAYLLRLAAYRYEDDDGWRHEFTLTGPNNRYSRIVAHTGTTDDIPPMSLIKAENSKVFYAVGRTDIDASQLDISDYPVVSWQIVAIGVKGESSCSFSFSS